MDSKDWIEVVKILLAAAGAGFALYQYRLSTRLKKAEWIESLHAKFFESANYKRIRGILDHENAADYENLKAAVVNPTDAVEQIQLSESFVDYLNFFEFIASLPGLVQLEDREIALLFDYYIRLLKRHDFVMQFIRTEGFEKLASLLDRWPANAGGNR